MVKWKRIVTVGTLVSLERGLDADRPGSWLSHVLHVGLRTRSLGPGHLPFLCSDMGTRAPLSLDLMKKRSSEMCESFVKYKALLKCIYSTHMPWETGNYSQSLHFLLANGGAFLLDLTITGSLPTCEAGWLVVGVGTTVVSVAAVTVQAASSAPWLLPRAALAVVMVGVAGPSACPASDAPFLGPCSCAWGQQTPLSPLSPRCLLPALSLPCPLQKESDSSLSIQSSCSFLPTKQNAPFLLFVGMPPPERQS